MRLPDPAAHHCCNASSPADMPAASTALQLLLLLQGCAVRGARCCRHMCRATLQHDTSVVVFCTSCCCRLVVCLVLGCCGHMCRATLQHDTSVVVLCTSCCCRLVVCLLLGCIHRARGCPTLQPTIAATVAAPLICLLRLLLCCCCCRGALGCCGHICRAMLRHDTSVVLCTSCCCCRGVLCLVLGCIHRARGCPTLQPTIAATVEALVAVASRPVGMAHIWALHGLWLVAGAAGPAYAPHVKQSLQLALELLVRLTLLCAAKCMQLS
jgi:hypothetical protein